MGSDTYAWTQGYFGRLRQESYMALRYWRKDIEGSESYPKRGTAPYEAVSAGHHKILSLLISNRSNIDEGDHEGRTSLYWAAFNGCLDTVRLLLENGARTHGHRYVPMWTPANWAHMRGFHGIRDLLVLTNRP